MISLVKIILSNDTRVKRIRAFFFLQIPEDLIQNNPHHSCVKYISIFNSSSKNNSSNSFK